MHYTNSAAIRKSEDFKERLMQLMELYNISDKELASIFGVSLQTISRWKNQLDESHLPAFALAMFPCNDKKYSEFIQAVLRYLASHCGSDIVANYKPGSLDGNLQNEVIESVKELGEISKHISFSPEEALRLRCHAEKLIQAGYTMLAEIDANVKQ